MTDQDDPALTDGRMTIWAHLAELRTRLIRCVIAIVVGIGVAFWLYDAPNGGLVAFLLIPFKELVGQDASLYATDPLDPFATRIKIAAYTGIVLAMPVWLWQVWRFVTPGLYPKEKRYAVPFVIAAILLFCLGATIAYLTLNPALQFLISIAGTEVKPIYSPDGYITLILYMMLAFGAGFQFPVLLVALQAAGVLTPQKLLQWWRSAIVIIAVVAAVITPSGDPISMMALGIPMLLLYFVSIGIGYVFYRRRRSRAGKADASSGSS